MLVCMKIKTKCERMLCPTHHTDADIAAVVVHAGLLGPREGGRVVAVHGVEVHYTVKPTDDVDHIVQRHHAVIRANPKILDVGHVPAVGPATIELRLLSMP